MPTPDEYQVAGLYDPESDAGRGRIELLDWLVHQGFTLAEIQRGFESGALDSMAGDRRLVPGERLDRSTALALAGVAAEEFDAISTALGFLPIDGSPPGEVGYTAAEADAIGHVGALAHLFSLDEAIGLVRVIGSALGRIGEAAVSLFLADIESPHLLAGSSELGLALKVHDAVGLLDGVTAEFDPILRRLTLQAIERTRRATIDETERFEYRYAIGFVDLVGFTSASRDMPPAALAVFMREFDGHAHDVATKAGARVVKLIGDEVMFVATEPSVACVAGRALIEDFADHHGVQPRGGVAYGRVVLRGGDYYGTVVNLASRLVDEAVPGELLVTEELAEVATACEFEPAGRRMVKGFDEPIQVRSLRTDSAVN